MSRAENKEKYKEYDHNYYIKHKRPKSKIGQAELKMVNLETKLAEHNEYFRSFSCENFNEFQDFISTFMLTPHEEQTLIRELKQKLAEKEKEIEIVKNMKADEMALKVIQKSNQDKIEFAIEKLEHLRNTIDNEIYYCYGDNNINIVINKNKFNELFDNQINELKEMK